MPTQFTRRQALASLAAAAALPNLTHAQNTSANGKLRTAHIGVGGMGRNDLARVADHPSVEVAALCDVDSERLAAAHSKHADAKTFADFRELFDTLGDTIDAVVVSTPDHTHAPAAMTALNAGKPVYCQKPLTHDIYEARQLRLAAEKSGQPTQMGVQIHSHAAYRSAVQIIRDGSIGRVSQVYAWSNKNWGYDDASLPAPQPAPETLDWNLWLGTAAERDYAPGVYHPAAWRKLIDFGTGTLGDMGVHIFDTPYTALELTAPNWVKTTCRQPSGVGHPTANTVEYEFPGTSHTTETLRWTWSDGSSAPPKVEHKFLPADVNLPGQGSLFIGENGAMLLPHIAAPRVYLADSNEPFTNPDAGSANHYHQWVDACLGKDECSADFTFGGKLTEALLLGVVGNRFPGQTLHWDADNLRVTNLAEANALIKRPYREGFTVPGLT